LRTCADCTPAFLAFYDAAGHVRTAEQLTIGQRAHASHLRFSQEARRRGTSIFAGLSPYFAYSVLYDADRQSVGLKPRAPAPGGPSAISPDS